MSPEEIRKGSWTEDEDNLLANVVNLFGDRRWDFVAKVSGLNRTGKSCRLRWVNYLHPGLKREKMTAHEERLVLELHAKWGNRWSRIARNLPGRTDNEIKNHWRTYMRKQVQERKQVKSSSILLSDSSSSTPTLHSLSTETEKGTSYYTDGVTEKICMDDNKEADEIVDGGYSMDDIWKCIDMKTESSMSQLYDTYNGGSFYIPLPVSPIWEYCSDSLWKRDEEEN